MHEDLDRTFRKALEGFSPTDSLAGAAPASPKVRCTLLSVFPACRGPLSYGASPRALSAVAPPSAFVLQKPLHELQSASEVPSQTYAPQHSFPFPLQAAPDARNRPPSRPQSSA